MTDTTPNPPGLRFAFRLTLDFDRAFTFPSMSGERGFLRAAGGKVEGPALTGTVFDHGGDWPVLRPDGVIDLDSRIMIEAGDGELIYMRSRGVLRLSPGQLADFAGGKPGTGEQAYFRCSPWFDTTTGSHVGLSGTMFLGTGSLTPERMAIDIFEVL